MATSFDSLMMPEMGLMGDPASLLTSSSMDSLAASMPAASQSMTSPEQISDESVIDKLTPGSTLHAKTLQKLNAYFDFSANAMSQMHPRWNWQELRVQAYIKHPKYRDLIQAFENNNGAPPEAVRIIVPYSYATLHAAATYIYSVLAGRRPVFPLLPSRGTVSDKARYMEQALQSNLEATKGYQCLWQLIWDALVYDVGAVRIGWAEEDGKRLEIRNGQREMVDGLKFAGNKMIPIDPYHFFPDPRVPMHKVNSEGDFVFWISHQSEMKLKVRERAGQLKYVKEACSKAKEQGDLGEMGPIGTSQRRARVGNDGGLLRAAGDVVKFIPIREGTIRLIPDDWGLNDSKDMELWKVSFTKDQIIQMQPLGMAHDKHPVAVAEPTSFGHEFGGLSFADFIGPFQDMLSWIVNSRIENVRTVVNNQFIVDPNRVEMQDLRTPAPGKAIRLKQAAIGTDVREAIHQLAVTDVTAGHFQDMQMLRLLGDACSGINDNMRGIQTAGGRRSATEARMAMQAGASRLSQMASLVSSQAIGDICDQMIMNIQQFMPDELWVEMSGDEEMPSSTLLTPDMIAGSFNYQISDGSLPYDKMAMVESWKEILMAVMQDPELRQRKDVVRIFDHIAVLGGAKNIKQFDRQQESFAPGQPPEGAIPAGPAMPNMPNFTGGQLMLPPPGQPAST
jgi:hypothetical protein